MAACAYTHTPVHIILYDYNVNVEARSYFEFKELIAELGGIYVTATALMAKLGVFFVFSTIGGWAEPRSDSQPTGSTFSRLRILRRS